MPRRDRTYSDKDITRIFKRNLTFQEQAKVCSVIVPLCKGIDTPLEEIDLLELIRKLLDVSKAIRNIVELLDIFLSDEAIEQIIDRLAELIGGIIDDILELT